MTPVKIKGVYYTFWTCVPGYCDKHGVSTRHKASLRTSDKREAVSRCNGLAERLEAERARNTLGLVAVASSTMTLSEFATAYRESTAFDNSEVTRTVYNGNLNQLVTFAGKDLPLKRVDQQLLERFKRERLKTVAPCSWNSQLGILKAVFSWGLTRNPPLYSKNPMDGITTVEGEATINKYVAVDQVQAVASQADPFCLNMLAFLFVTMCRSGELRRLRKADIHWDQGYLEFTKPKERRKKRVKRLPLTPDVIMILDKAKKLHPTSEYVFPAKAGGMMTKRQVYYYIQLAGQKAGVKLSPHMLRHSGITNALSGGAEAWRVQAVAGHADIQTTLGYQHTNLADQRKAMELLGGLDLTQGEAGKGNTGGDSATKLLLLPPN